MSQKTHFPPAGMVKSHESLPRDRRRYVFLMTCRTASHQHSQRSMESVKIPYFDESNDLGAQEYVFQPDANSVSLLIFQATSSHPPVDRPNWTYGSCKRSCAWFGLSSIAMVNLPIGNRPRQTQTWVIMPVPAYSWLTAKPSTK